VGGTIHIDGDQLLEVQGKVEGLAVAVGEIARGAYVTETLFMQSQGRSTGAMDDVLHVLAEAANAMQDCAQKLADYLARIFIEFEATDLSLVAHVNSVPE
jgi:hypothetical protein